MGRPRENKQEVGYLEDAWLWCRDLGGTHDVGVRVVLHPSGQRGVWVVRVEAVHVVEGRAVAVAATVRSEYPDASPVTFSGRLYSLMVKLDQELTADPLMRRAQP